VSRELANLNSMVEDEVGFDTAIREKYIAGQLWQSGSVSRHSSFPLGGAS
jgi:hypothetical protein